jgi:hypothetical protein
MLNWEVLAAKPLHGRDAHVTMKFLRRAQTLGRRPQAVGFQGSHEAGQYSLTLRQVHKHQAGVHKVKRALGQRVSYNIVLEHFQVRLL